MRQLQFKMSFSVGTKLLLSVTLLIVSIIGFLNVSAIFLLKEDKQAYIFQSKLTEAVLAGSEFVNTVRHVFDTLRISTATADPRRPVTPEQKNALQAVIDNQSDVVFVETAIFNAAEAKLEVIAEAVKAEKLKEVDAKPEDFALSPEWLNNVGPDLKKDGYAFMNLSRPGGVPMLGVFYADAADHADRMAVAFAALPLKRFGAALSSLNMTIASRSGWLLFDTDAGMLYSRANIKNDPLFVFSLGNPTGNGTHEYVANGVRYLGSFVYPGFELVVLTRAEWSKAMKASYALTEKFVLLGLMSLGAAILFAIFFSKTLTAPIKRLYEATKEVGSGNFHVDLKGNSGDEIGELTRSFNTMSSKISELFQESVEKVKLENELSIASTVQQNLLPPVVYQNDKVMVHSYYQSASQCGGDWWGVFTVGNKVVIGIADATGHGLPCALITASARSCFSFMQKMAEEDPRFDFSPKNMLSHANRVIYDSAMGKIMMTFFLCVLDFDKGEIHYSNAGHNPPWLFHRQGDKYELKSLTAVGTRLGETRDEPKFEDKKAPLSVDDMLFLYTDGAPEGKSQAGEMYGKRRMRNLVEKSLYGGPEAVVGNLVNDLQKHFAGVAQDDDVTLAVVKVMVPPATA